MKINQNAVQSLICSTIGENNDARRELMHALEYYLSAPSDRSVCRLLSAASAIVKQNEYPLFNRGAASRLSFCNLVIAEA